MALTSFTAGETISPGNVVFLNGSGFLYKASAGAFAQASAVGVSLDSSLATNLTRVDSDSVYSAFSALTPGSLQYLSITVSGTLVDYPSWNTEFTNLTASGAFLTKIGRALTTSGVAIEIEKPIYVTK